MSPHDPSRRAMLALALLAALAPGAGLACGDCRRPSSANETVAGFVDVRRLAASIPSIRLAAALSHRESSAPRTSQNTMTRPCRFARRTTAWS
jgi:hypothetical protein